MSSVPVIAIDIGKTGARIARWTDCDTAIAGGLPSVVFEAAGFGGLAGADGVASADRIVQGLLSNLGDRADVPPRIAVGVAGALAVRSRAQELAERIARHWPGSSVIVTSDAVTAHLGALSGQPGVVATLGTGITALAVNISGQWTRVDGWGPQLGDAGGGAQIGRDGLRAVLRHHDGRGPATALTAAAITRFGSLDGLSARFESDPNPARLAASFAPDVAVAAASDDLAAAIMDEAAVAIAESITAAARFVGTSSDGQPVPAALTGGLIQLGPALLDRLRAALGAAVALIEPTGDAIRGAALLAALDTTLWEATVVRAGGAELSPTPTSLLDRLTTEQARDDADDLESISTEHLVRRLLDHERQAQAALDAVAPELAAVVDAVAERMADGGRLIYVGAGTPGRLAFLDAAECVPTFGVPGDQVVALIAGGEQAVRSAVEGAEDDAAAGRADVDRLAVRPLDSVLGIAASGRTPYVIGAIERAGQLGALTVGIANNPGSALAAAAERSITIDSGAEVLAGSTRLAAGTTQKITLNVVSTAVMVQLGKTYRGRMVDLQATNDKLRRRAIRIVAELTGLGEAAATELLARCDGEVKTALVMQLTGVDPAAARAALAASNGRVAAAVDQAAP